MSGVEPERYQLWRKTAADWIVSRLRAAGRSGRWRYMADLLHLLEQPALRNAFFPPEEEAPPVEPARADDFDQIFEIVGLGNGSDERACMELWARRLPHRFSVARGSKGEVLAFYLFARQDDPHSGLGAVDPLFAAWQAHLAAGGKYFPLRVKPSARLYKLSITRSSAPGQSVRDEPERF
jgi:hypothetical protein